MKAQNQTLLVILAVIFAVSLALAVSVICFAALPKETAPLEDPPPEVIEDPDGSLPASSGSEEVKEPVPVPEKNGLLYQSNGDGTCVLCGVGSCSDACVVIPERTDTGEKVTAIAPDAFFGCETVVAIQIPASVTVIGERAFASCSRLCYVCVQSGNTFFRDEDGVLYSRDRSTLILYPPMHSGNSIVIPAEVKSISEMAFYGCSYLSSVTFLGSAESWESISIAPKNYSLTAAAKTFNK